MKLTGFFALIFLTLAFSSCSLFGQKETAQREVYLTDKPIAETSENAPLTPGEIEAEPVDYSSDSFGNQTETRCFPNNSRVSCVTLIISAKGEKQATVFTKGSGARQLPAGMVERAMTASPEDLATAVGVLESRPSATIPAGFARQGQKSQPLQPMPSYRFPVPVQIESPAVEEAPATENVASEDAATENARPQTAQNNPSPDAPENENN